MAAKLTKNFKITKNENDTNNRLEILINKYYSSVKFKLSAENSEKL